MGKDWSEESKKYLFGDVGMDIILMGNSGCGKSTIISSLSKTQFLSGLSETGSGMTTDVQWLKEERTLSYPDGEKEVNLRWADTPGLADASISEKAAASLTECIRNSKEGGRAIKPIFVVTLRNGRIIADDLISIDKVMTSIKMDESLENTYTVLVNQVPNRLFDKQDPTKVKTDTRYKLIELFNKGVSYKTDSFIFIKKLAYLDEEDNARLEDELAQPLLCEITLLSPFIKMAEVKQVDELKTDDFKALAESLKAAQEEYGKKLKEAIDSNNAQHKAAMELMEKKNDDQKELLQQQIENLMEINRQNQERQEQDRKDRQEEMQKLMQDMQLKEQKMEEQRRKDKTEAARIDTEQMYMHQAQLLEMKKDSRSSAKAQAAQMESTQQAMMAAMAAANRPPVVIREKSGPCSIM